MVGTDNSHERCLMSFLFDKKKTITCEYDQKASEYYYKNLSVENKYIPCYTVTSCKIEIMYLKG